MPEYFDDDIPIVRRTAKDVKLRRNVRKDQWPDYVSKQFVKHECAVAVYAYLDTNSMMVMTDYTKLFPRFPALDQPDPFGLHSFHMKYSMNKKKRWEIDSKLSDGIFNYQDEAIGLRTSYVRTVMHDTGWLYRYHWKWFKNNNVSEVEMATVRNGEHIHKYAIRAQRGDLLRDPNEPRRGKCRWSRREVTFHKRRAGLLDSKLHILYKTTTTRWDRRAACRHDKKLAQKEGELKKTFIRKSDDAKKLESREEYELPSRFCFDKRSRVISLSGDDEQHVFNVTAVPLSSFIVGDSQRRQSSRRNPGKRRLSKQLSTDYIRWYYTSPSSEMKQSENAIIASTAQPSCDNLKCSSEDVIDDQVEPLPSFVTSFPLDTSLHDYVMKRFPLARQIRRLLPEAYIAEITGENLPEIAGSDTGFDCFVVFRLVDNQKLSHSVRWIVNNKFVNASNTETRRSLYNCYRKSVHCFAKYLPKSLMLNVECWGEPISKDSAICDWLNSLNERVRASDRIPVSNVCAVCMSGDCDDCDGFSLHCGHYFCTRCWVRHANECLNNSRVPIKCLAFACEAVVELPQARSFIPYNSCERYEKLLWEKWMLIMDCMYCVNCDRILHVTDAMSTRAHLALCLCGSANCARCKCEDHHPMSCLVAQQYNELLRCNGEQMNMVADRESVMLRRCPKCRSLCEREEGCDSMECYCGFPFCWECGEWREFNHECSGTKKMTPIYLFDVNSVTNKPGMQRAYERIWVYRMRQKHRNIAKFRSKVTRVSKELSDVADVYCAALRFLELSEISLQLLKDEAGEMVVLKRGIYWEKPLRWHDWRMDCMRSYIDRLKFIVGRLVVVVDMHPKRSSIRRLSTLIENVLKDLLSVEYFELECSAGLMNRLSASL